MPNPPGIVIGARMAEDSGMIRRRQHQGRQPGRGVVPLGPLPAVRRFKVVGIFETGFYDIDELWAFTSLRAAQKFLSLKT